MENVSLNGKKQCIDNIVTQGKYHSTGLYTVDVE